MPRLILKTNGEQIEVESFDLKLGVNTLGRTVENDLRINHPTVSTFHCEVVWMNDMVEVRDHESTNGTFIDGERIKEARLEPGHLLRIGDLEMSLDTDTASISVPNLNTKTAVITETPPPG